MVINENMSFEDRDHGDVSRSSLVQLTPSLYIHNLLKMEKTTERKEHQPLKI